MTRYKQIHLDNCSYARGRSRDVNETRETRKNFSVSSIEFLAVEKFDKQLDR